MGQAHGLSIIALEVLQPDADLSPSPAAISVAAGYERSKTALVFSRSEKCTDHASVISGLAIVQDVEPEIKTSLIWISP